MADQVPTVPTINPVSTTPQTPQVGVPLSQTPQTESGSSKSMFWVILAAFIVVAILVGAGIYMYMMARQTNPEFQQISQNVQESLDSVANDLTGVQAEEDVTKDFADVDKDLNSL
jgi:flagellar basal body-associated protein FliL